MKIDFVKNTRRVIVATLLSNGVHTLIPFFRKTVFMWVLGSEYLGLNGLFYSVLGMLMLSELGFGRAIVCYMYKPVADDNHDLFCAYLRFYRNIFRCVGSFIFIGGLCLLPFLPQLIHGHIPADVNLYVLYLMFLTNSAIGYSFFAYRGSILSAHHRNDIATHIGSCLDFLELVVACIVLYFTRNNYYYVTVLIANTLLKNIFVFIATRIYYPDIIPKGQLPKEEVRRIIADVKAIFMHKIGGVVNGSFDNIVISAFIGLSAVGAFGNYSHISGAVASITSGICYSMTAGFGNKIYTESREENFKLLMKVNRMLLCLIIGGAAMLLALYQPFIVLWTRKDPTLIRHFLTVILMVVWFYEKQTRETLRMFKNAAAIWQADRWKAVIAAAANLALNITFVKTFPDAYKLDGVILSTVVTDIIIQMPWESHAVFSKFFTRKEALHYWKRQAFFFPIAILICGLAWLAAYAVPLEGFTGLVAKGASAFVVSVVSLAPFFLNDMKMIMAKFLHR